jgi:hypothetical protein
MKLYRIEPPKHLRDFLSEASHLSTSELFKYRNIGTKEYDRVSILIQKIASGGEMLLLTGDTVNLDPEACAGIVDQLSTHDPAVITALFGKGVKQNPVLIDTNGVPHKITDFAKSADFGGAAGAATPSVKTDAKQTEIQEIGQALVLGLQLALKKPPTIEDITNPNILTKGARYTVPDCSSMVPAVIQKVQSDAAMSWGWSFIHTAVAIGKKFSVDGMEFHRDGPWMDGITDLYITLNKAEKPKPFSQKDKWNPADIWIVKVGTKVPQATSLKELNGWLLEQFKAGSVIGVSLKKTAPGPNGSAKVEIFNNDPIATQIKAVVKELVVCRKNNLMDLFRSKQTNIDYKTESVAIPLGLYYKLTEADNGTVSNRTSNAGTEFRSEIEGQYARGGNLSYSGVNKILHNLTGKTVTSRLIIQTWINEPEGDRKVVTKIMDMAEAVLGTHISKDDRGTLFKTAREKGTEDRLVSKYQSVELLYILNAARATGDQVVNDFISQLLTVAGAKTDLSSVYAKVS